jgi:hypothetical protein
VTYVVVIAKQGSGEPPKIYRGKTVTNVLNRIRSEYVREIFEWTKEMDSYVLANYRALGATVVAQNLKTTKNAVIGRYHRIKGGNHGS